MNASAVARIDQVATACGERMRELRRVYTGAVVVTFIPPKEVFLIRDDMTPYQRRLNAFMAALQPHRVEFIDVLEAIPASEILRLFFKIDTHFNAAGHSWFAELLEAHPPAASANSGSLETPLGLAYGPRPELGTSRSHP